MKKVAYFFASFLPLIITLGIPFLAVFFMIAIAALFLFLSIPAFRSHAGTTTQLFELLMDSDFNGMIMVIYSILCIVLFGLWYYHNCGGDYLPNPKKTFSSLQFAGIVVLVPGAQFFCSYMIGFLSMAFPKWLEQYERIMETAGLDESITPILLCYAVLLGPINEELIFRGVTMRLARQSLPFWGANILQAILFGILHGNWLQGCYAATLGLLLGVVCEKGGSIYYSILLHILFNLWGTVLSELLSGVEDSMLFSLLMFLGMIVSLGLGLFLFIFGMKKKEKRGCLS